MSDHGEILSPLQHGTEVPPELHDAVHSADISSNNFQNSKSDHNRAYNEDQVFSNSKYSSLDNNENYRERSQSTSNEMDPAAQFPGLNQLAGIVPTAATFTNLVPTNANDALVTVMPWMEEEKELLPHQEAAILLEFARDGQDLNGSKLSLRSRLCYRIRRKYHWVFRVAAWSLLLIHMFQRPVWTREQNKAFTWNDSHHFPSWDLTYLDYTEADVLIFVALLVNWIGVGLELGYKRNTSNAYQVYVSAAILFVKSVFNFTNFVLIGQNLAPVSCSPIEGFLVLLIELQYDNSLSFLIRSVPKFCLLMVGMAVFVMIYTALGMMIFNPDENEGQTVFRDYGVALWNMAMVLNGANWPGPMVPALINNRFFVMYFYVFLMVVVWGLLNIVLGFNYLFFQSEQKTISDMQEKTRVDNKAEAFRILDIEKKGFLSYEQVDVLLKEMYEFYEELSDVPNVEERHELILALDIQSNHMIDENDFYFIEQKCFQGALKHLRAKKRKFTRYISAHIIKEQSEQLMKEQTDKLKQVTAKVGLKIGEGKDTTVHNGEMSFHASAHASTHGSTHAVRGAYSSLEDDTGHVKNPLVVSETTAAKDIDDPVTDSQNIEENQSSTNTVATRELVNKQARAELIEAAARYAGMFRDPKLVAWYHTVGNRQIEALSKARGRSFGQVVSHFAMQVDSIYFDIFSDTVIVGIGIALLLHKPHPAFAVTYNVFTLSEMVVKFLVKGYHRYVSSNRSSIDGRIALSLLTMNIVGAVVPAPNHTQVVVKTLVLIRTLLYPRNLIVTNGFKSFRARQRVAFTYAFNSMDHFAFLLLVLVAMMYVFSGVGLQIFGGMIDRQSNRVASSDYAALGYWPLNFNDIPSGMVTMFTLLSVNDMNVTASGFVAVLSQWAEVFFILWYCLGVLFLLNICTAVFLNQIIGYLEHLSTERQAAKEAEMLEYDQQSQAQFELEDALRKQFGEDYGPDGGSGSYSEGEGDSVPAVIRSNKQLFARTSRSLSNEYDQQGDENSGPSTPSPFRSPARPSWSGDSGVGASDRAFVPEPEFHEDSVRRQSMEEGHPKNKGLISSAGALFSDATQKTSNVLLGGTATANALLADTTDKAKDLMQVSTSGLTNFVRLFTIDESEENARGTAASDRRASTGMGMGFGNNSTHSMHSPVRHRMSAVGSTPSSFRTKRGSQFTALATMAEEEEEEEVDEADQKLEEDLGGLEEVIRQDEEEEGGGMSSAPVVVVPSATFAKSIFTTDADRHEIDAWVNSRRKKRGNRASRSRVNSFGTSTVRSRAGTHSSGGTRSRGNTNSEATRSRGNTLSRSRTNTSISATPDIKDRGRSLDWDASEGPQVAFPGGELATNPLHEDFQADGIEMSPKIKGFLSLGQAEDDAVVHSQDYKLMSFYDWFYKEDQVSPVEEAAVLLQGAIDGDDPELFTSRRGLWCFQKRTQYSNWFKISAALYSLLKFFQRPTWTFNYPEWNNSTYFPVSGMPQWSPVVTGSLKIPLLIVMFIGLSLEVGYQDSGFCSMFRNLTWKRTKRYLLQFYCVVQFCLVLYSFGDGSVKLVALTSCGSMLYVMWFVRRSFRKARIVAKVIPPLSKVLLLYLLIICIFSGFGPFLYNIEDVADDDTTTEYFADFRTATWSIFIAISTSSYPNQIMPAYREYREFALFFFCFVTIGTLIMLNLIIAIVFVEFQKASLVSAEFQRTVRKVFLMESFQTLDVDEMDFIDTNTANALINEMHAHYPAFRKAGRPDGLIRNAFIALLDADEDGRITMEDYLKIPEIAKTKLATVPGPTFMELWFPKIVEGKAFQFLKKCVLYPYTNLIFDVTIAIFTVTSMAVNADNLFASTPSSVALGAVQMGIMVMEATVKLLVRGWSRYRRSFRNQLDFTITCGAFIAVCGASAHEGVSGYTLARRTLLVFRLFWLPRNIRYVLESKSIKQFAKMCWRIVGKTLTLGVVFLCILYAFSSIGMFAFGGLINRDPNGPHYNALMNSRYAADGYWPLNFNDFASSFITVFCCLHVSDFDVITEGMTVASNNTAHLFFAIWYVIGVLLMLNILKSFFLDEFLNVFNAAVSKEEEPSKEIENAPPNEGLVNLETEIDVVNPIVQGLPSIEEDQAEKEPAQSVEEQVFNPLRDSAAAAPLPVYSGPPPHDTDSLQASIFSPEKPKKPKCDSKPSAVAFPPVPAPSVVETDLLDRHVAAPLVGTPPLETRKVPLRAAPSSPELPPRKPKRESKPHVVAAVESSVPVAPAMLPPPSPMAPPPVLPSAPPSLPPPPPLPSVPPPSPSSRHVPESVPYSEVDEAVADDYEEESHADHPVDVMPLVEEGENEEEEEVEVRPVEEVSFAEIEETQQKEVGEVEEFGVMEEEEDAATLLAAPAVLTAPVVPVMFAAPPVPPPLPPVPPPPVPPAVPALPAGFDSMEYLEEVPEEELLEGIEESVLVVPADLPTMPPPPPPPVPPMPPVFDALPIYSGPLDVSAAVTDIPANADTVAESVVTDSLLDFDALVMDEPDMVSVLVEGEAEAAAAEPESVTADAAVEAEEEVEAEAEGEGEVEAQLSANVSVRGRSSSGMGGGSKSNKKKKSKNKK